MWTRAERANDSVVIAKDAQDILKGLGDDETVSVRHLMLQRVSKRSKPFDHDRIDWNALVVNGPPHLDGLLQHPIEDSPHTTYLCGVTGRDVAVLGRVAAKIEQLHTAIIKVDQFQPLITKGVLRSDDL